MGKEHTGLGNISRNSRDVAEYYDKWAKDYNTTLDSWQYDAPKKTAAIIREMISGDAEVLDAGCGTGMCGKALSEQGFTVIDGVDISEVSLHQAEKSGVYRSLKKVNMQELPLPIDENKYDALSCVGVMTYLEDSYNILKEFSRLVKPGSPVSVTHRDDIYNERNFDKVLESLEKDNIIRDVKVTDPLPYLPENEEFSDKINVRYITFRAV